MTENTFSCLGLKICKCPLHIHRDTNIFEEFFFALYLFVQLLISNREFEFNQTEENILLISILRTKKMKILIQECLAKK